jgi:crotonobetainyl-CoA:carnitine CoA-transferase CaiB-like acyl-CoA transferase
MPQEQIFAWEEEFQEFFLRYTKAKLLDEGTKRGALIFPCNNTEECLEDAHLAEREYWVTVEHPELGSSIVYPGAPFKLNNAVWKISRPAPLIGEHNEEIYIGELGFSKEELVLLKETNVI